MPCRDLLHASDRLAAGRAQFQPAALRSRLPLQSRARARERRTDRAAQGRAGGDRASAAIASAAWSANWMLIMTRTKKLTFFTAGLFAGLDRLSLCRGQPGLFRRHDAARRADADRIRLQQRAERRCRSSSTVYRSAGGMARGDRSGWTGLSWRWRRAAQPRVTPPVVEVEATGQGTRSSCTTSR